MCLSQLQRHRSTLRRTAYRPAPYQLCAERSVMYQTALALTSTSGSKAVQDDVRQDLHTLLEELAHLSDNYRALYSALRGRCTNLPRRNDRGADVPCVRSAKCRRRARAEQSRYPAGFMLNSLIASGNIECGQSVNEGKPRHRLVSTTNTPVLDGKVRGKRGTRSLTSHCSVLVYAK